MIQVLCKRVSILYLLIGLLTNENLRILRIGKNPIQSAGAYGVLTALRQNTRSAMEIVDFTDVVVKDDNVLSKL